MPGTYDLGLYRGDTSSWKFRLWSDKAKTIPLNLDGVVAKAEYRDVPGGTVLITFDCSILLPNTVSMDLTSTMWDDVAVQDGVWDLELTFPDGAVKTPVAGDVVVTPDVTNSVPVVGGLIVGNLSAPVPVVRRPVSLSA